MAPRNRWSNVTKDQPCVSIGFCPSRQDALPHVLLLTFSYSIETWKMWIWMVVPIARMLLTWDLGIMPFLRMECKALSNPHHFHCECYLARWLARSGTQRFYKGSLEEQGRIAFWSSSPYRFPEFGTLIVHNPRNPRKLKSFSGHSCSSLVPWWAPNLLETSWNLKMYWKCLPNSSANFHQPPNRNMSKPSWRAAAKISALGSHIWSEDVGVNVWTQWHSANQRAAENSHPVHGLSHEPWAVA